MKICPVEAELLHADG